MNLIDTKADLGLSPDFGCDAPKSASTPTWGAISKFDQEFVNARNAQNNAGAVDGVVSKSHSDQGRKSFSMWEKDVGFSFGDFIDIINPLHHIPIVATIYRNFSGDQIGAASRVIGGAVWGRVGGLIAGLANAFVEWWSGKDIGDHIYAAIFDSMNKNGTAVTLAGESAPIVTDTKSPPATSLRGKAAAVAPIHEPQIVSPLSRATFFHVDLLSPKSRSWLA